MMEIGETVPDTAFQLADGTSTTLTSFRGKPLVLYFYPKDDTSGCTREAQDFTALISDFRAAGAEVLGVSRDSPASHVKFSAKYALDHFLGSDGGALSDAFGTWVEKSMYGRKYMGMARATFLIDGEGRVRTVWRKVKVPGHAQAVLDSLNAL